MNPPVQDYKQQYNMQQMELGNQQFSIQSGIPGLLQPYLQNLISTLPQQIPQKVKQLIHHYTQRNFLVQTLQNFQYFSLIWKKQLQAAPDLQQLIIPRMKQRYHKVYRELCNQTLLIQSKPTNTYDFQSQEKNNKIYYLKQQSNSLRKKINQINGSLNQTDNNALLDQQGLSRTKLYDVNNKQKLKEFEEKKKKFQRQKQERQKKLEQARKKQEEQQAKKQAELKQQHQKLAKQRRDEINRKLKEKHQLRQKQKQMRQQRNSQYLRMVKEEKVKPPLYRKIQNDYSKRYHEVQRQQRQRYLTERKSAFQHIDDMKLEQHGQFYEKIKQEREKKRKQRLQAYFEEQKSRVQTYHSTHEFSKLVDQRDEQRRLAKEKLEKVKQYKEIVKEKYQPKVDERKKNQLIELIRDIEQSKKKFKKVQLKKGGTRVQQLVISDPSKVGLEYLDMVKQMALKYKAMGKRKSSEDNIVQVKEKKIDYLEELRNNRPRGQTSRTNKMKFMEKKDISYEDKIKKVEIQAQKLYELTRQKEQKLKFGKFKSSEEILACKEQIDHNYMEIVRMKLQLLNPNDGVQLQDSYLE